MSVMHKIKNMKQNKYLLIILMTILLAFIAIFYARFAYANFTKEDVGIAFTFANGEITAGGTNGYYEFDVMANASATGTRIGTGMVYLNYSTLGFGQSIYGNSKVTVTKGTLTSNAGPPLYLLLLNDNTSSLLAVTFEYTSAAGWGNSLPTTPTGLIHVKIVIEYPSETAGLSFENSLMINCQFYDDNATKYDPVIAIDTDNTSLPVTQQEFEPTTFGILHNIPNPFGTTSLYTSLNILSPKQGKLSLNVYNIKGQIVNTLYNNDVQKNQDIQLSWDGKNSQGKELSSGIYLYQLLIENRLYETKKVVIIR